MNAIRWIQEHGDASSLTLGAIAAANQEPTFYPAGWHDFVYLIYSTTGTSIATATIVMILLAAGIIWPCSLIAMCLSIPHLRPLQALAIPALTCGFLRSPVCCCSGVCCSRTFWVMPCCPRSWRCCRT